MNLQTHIRFAKPDDIHQIIDLCDAHAVYEKCEYSKDNKANQLADDLFSETTKLHCLVAENSDKLIGYATYMKQYSTWDANEYIYMDCLYLKEVARGAGIGEKMIRKIQEEGKKLGCNLIQWQTPDFNVRAIKFYKKIGATSKNKKRFFLDIDTKWRKDKKNYDLTIQQLHDSTIKLKIKHKMRNIFKITAIIITLTIAVSCLKNKKTSPAPPTGKKREYVETLPTGTQGKEADALATKMLKAINHMAYKNTRFLEWSFRGSRFYKWDKQNNIVEVKWSKNKVILHTKSPEKSEVFVDEIKVENKELIKKATNYFNNDSFWLVAPHKVFEKGIERRLVKYEGKDTLLITYTTGGSTPGDSYLWILDSQGIPTSYKMWVSVMPDGGVESTWDGWKITESGTKLPTTHKLKNGELNMGEVKGYN